MPPLIQEALGSIVRAGLQIFAGYVVAAGIWTAEDAGKYVAAGALALVAIGWSLWQKYSSRSTLVTALASSTPMSEDAAKAKSSLPSAPSVSSPSDVTPG